jgi:putative endonuclease
MSNDWNTVIYAGVTNDLHRRVLEHQSGRGGRFTSKYQVRKLVYYEVTTDVYAAIEREKQIKAGSRRKKIELIESVNSGWKDLSEEIGL